MLLEAGLNDFEDYSPVKPDKYNFVIKKPAEVIPSDDKTDIGGKCVTIVIRPEIVGGEQAGKEVRRQFSNKSKGARYFLKSFLEKIGVPVTKEGGFATEDLLGRQFSAQVKDRSYVQDGIEKKASDLDSESALGI